MACDEKLGSIIIKDRTQADGAVTITVVDTNNLTVQNDDVPLNVIVVAAK